MQLASFDLVSLCSSAALALPQGTELLCPVEVMPAVTGTFTAAVPIPYHSLCLWGGGSDWSSGEGRAPSPGSRHPTGTMDQGHRTVLLLVPTVSNLKCPKPEEQDRGQPGTQWGLAKDKAVWLCIPLAAGGRVRSPGLGQCPSWPVGQG